MKESLYINFYGVRVKVHCQNQELLDNLRRDFSYFVVRGKIDTDITIQVFVTSPPHHKIPPLKASMYLPDGIIYDDDKTRYVDYQGETLTIYNRKLHKAEIFSRDTAMLHEVVYLFILSTVGQAFDKEGIHRIHALGITLNSKSVLCLLPQGGGKTTLALELLKYESIELLSDDTPLITKTGKVLPFPLRMGIKELPKEVPRKFLRRFERRKFGQKYLVDIDYFKNKIGEISEPKCILLGERYFSKETKIIKIPKYRAIWPFVVNCVVGLGLPQVVEYFLRSDLKSILSLFRIAIRRFIASLTIIAKSQTYKIALGTDTKKNAKVLYDFLKAPNKNPKP